MSACGLLVRLHDVDELAVLTDGLAQVVHHNQVDVLRLARFLFELFQELHSPRPQHALQ